VAGVRYQSPEESERSYVDLLEEGRCSARQKRVLELWPPNKQWTDSSIQLQAYSPYFNPTIFGYIVLIQP